MIYRSLYSMLVAGVLGLVCGIANADIAGDATIKEMIMPAGTEDTAVVAFNIPNPPASFTANCVPGNGRVKFSKSNKQLLSFLMFAYATNKKVGFYFDPSGTTLGGINGHGVGTCELINIWAVQ